MTLAPYLSIDIKVKADEVRAPCAQAANRARTGEHKRGGPEAGGLTGGFPVLPRSGRNGREGLYFAGSPRNTALLVDQAQLIHFFLPVRS